MHEIPVPEHKIIIALQRVLFIQSMHSVIPGDTIRVIRVIHITHTFLFCIHFAREHKRPDVNLVRGTYRVIQEHTLTYNAI
ncbi:hypothetical protein PV02_00210 [Methanolobus chelungpuianus]|uniref:Uncharacterized protein n=1 Tax=Methanolobus chelungpuianus TaxID=502115 RepID=A0AAE3H8J5_9EURY|nr:hypothetical protein [Methanolobus chelungpuianus]